MLVCRDVTELVSDYIERSLPPQRRFGVWLHLLRCGACPCYIDQMRKTMQLLARGRFASPPSEFEDRLIADPGNAPPA